MTTSKLVSDILEEVSTETYRDGMDYFGLIEEVPSAMPPETAVEAAQLRAAKIQAGHVYGLTRRLV